MRCRSQEFKETKFTVPSASAEIEPLTIEIRRIGGVSVVNWQLDACRGEAKVRVELSTGRQGLPSAYLRQSNCGWELMTNQDDLPLLRNFDDHAALKLGVRRWRWENGGVKEVSVTQGVWSILQLTVPRN